MPIYKHGKRTDLSNYRPISIISIVAKIFGRIVHDQFYSYLINNELLSEYQSGFRPTYSTVTALLQTTNNWCVNIDKGLLNGVIFIDLIEIGTTLGPLLFLIYINDLPNCLNVGSPRMYADDTNISFKSKNLVELQDCMNTELKNLNTWLEVNKVSLNIAKTEFMVIGSRQRLATHGNLDLDVFVDNKRIKRVSSSESLGLTIDENLNWSKHIDNISKNVSSGIGALKRMRSFIDKETAIKVYQGLIEPYLTYCASVWDGMGCELCEKLQKLQNRAARAITCASYDIRTTSLLEELKWNKLVINRKKQKAILMHKTIKKMTPQYLQEMFTFKENDYSLRDSDNKLIVPQPRTEYLKRSFSYSGALLWNSLSGSLRSMSSISSFKNCIDEFYTDSNNLSI